MDIATIVGLLGAFGLIFASIDDIGAFIDTPSILIVLCGSAMVTMARSSLAEFLSAGGVAGKCFMYKLDSPKDLIETMVELATIARKDGMMALEGQEVPDKFFEKGLQMLVDGADETKLTDQLNRELKAMKTRHENSTGVFQAWVDLAPAMGMIGTLIGLVAMLGNMADPKAIGPAMAVALLTTLYGAMIANCIFMPIVTKLEGYSAHELLYREMVVMGLKFISRGESPRNITDQLVANLPPKIQAQIEEAA